MAPDPNHIAWVDLETTGTHEEYDMILEVGIIITDLELEEVDRRSWLVTRQPADWSHIYDSCDDVVQQMHNANGLWVLLADVPDRKKLSILAVDSDITDWVWAVTGSRRHVILAGSGVAHFDRRFINAQMPSFKHRLTYYALDVGILRRACQWWNPELVYPATGNDKPHRALADAELHLAEARHYREVLTGAMPPVPEDALQ